MAMAGIARAWTLPELHRLPDDGNKYELVRGELFVTPAPTEAHETIAARLTRLLDPFVAANRLGAVYHPRAVIRYRGSEVEPDLMVRRERMRVKESWERAPVPILVIEIASPVTRRRDRLQKRKLYEDAGVAEYWVIDPSDRQILVARQGEPDLVETIEICWQPPGCEASLRIACSALFEESGAETW